MGAVAVLLLATLAPGLAAAANLAFNGGAVANCPLNGTVYTCPSLPLANWNDTMSIASGYTVNINANTTFGYNQGLSMSGTAKLNVTGNLDLGGLNPSSVQLSGGSLVASGSFAIGASSVTFTADVTAASVTLGSGSVTMTGNVTSTGAVSIASNSRITGSITAGSLSTSSSVMITGSVTASGPIDLASYSSIGGAVKGTNISAGTAASPQTNISFGNSVTASGALTLSNGSTVAGDVTANTLTLLSSAATINGNATVQSADLEWQGRVVKTIYCKGGTANGACDCVTNNSGYAVGSTSGPRCSSAPAALQPNVLHHLQITHDGVASACAPETVTVTACANAACTSNYTGGVKGTLSPGGASFTTTAAGTAQATVQYGTPGTVALSVGSATPAASSALVCTNTGSTTTGCNMQFSGEPGLVLTMADQKSDAPTQGTLGADMYDPNKSACVAAFANQTLPVTLTCGYANPTSGTLPVLAKFGATGTEVALNSGNNSAAACDNTGRSFNVTFDANGASTLTMRYPDVGAVNLAAAATIANGQTIKANDTVVVAPASFRITAPSLSQTPPLTVIAGAPRTTNGAAFTATAVALTLNNAVAPNFGKETAPESVSFGAAQGSPCTGVTLGIINNVAGAATTGPGVSRQILYSEVGGFNLTVKQTSDYYLGGSIAAPLSVTASAPSGCGGIVAVPAYFQVAPASATYYSRQPIGFTITAKNGQGVTTANYDNAAGYSKAVTVSAVDPPATTPPSPAIAGLGALRYVTPSAITPSPVSTVPASAFSKGVATIGAAGTTYYDFKFANPATGPTAIVLRATDASGVTSNAASTFSAFQQQGSETSTLIRSGRVRIGNAFGTKTGQLVLPVNFEYYNGSNWMINTGESGTIPLGAIGVKATGNLVAPTLVVPGGASGIAYSAGQAKLTLQPQANGGVGTAFVTINLASGSAPSTCLTTAQQPGSTTGMGMPWLRAPDVSCNGASSAVPKDIDPVARATFGVFTPETRRIIHAREVFN